MPNAREKSRQNVGIYAHLEKDAGRKTYAQDPPIDGGKVRGVGPSGGEAVPVSSVQPLDDVAALGPSPRPSPRGRGGGLGERGSGEGGRRWGASIVTRSPALMALARQLRRDQTDAERLLWRLLRNQRFCGLKFRRQHPIEPYVLDFYCHEERLGIELDGGQHAAPDTQRSDTARTAFLESEGITIVRFWNHEVLQDPEAVLERLYRSLGPSPRPSPKGRGGELALSTRSES